MSQYLRARAAMSLAFAQLEVVGNAALDYAARVDIRQTRCPYCGEPLDVFPDLDGGQLQSYVEDCAVCCHPLRITAAYDPETDEFAIEASRDL